VSARAAVRRRLTADSQAAAGGVRWLTAPPRIASALADAALPIAPDAAWTLWVCAGAVGAVAGVLVGGPALGALVGAGAVGAGALGVRSRRGRAAAVLEAQLPVALEAMARSLRSGASLRQAVTEAEACGGMVAGELRGVVADLDRGLGLVDALDRWQARRPLAGVRLAVAALALGAETGGAQARAVDGVAATLRDRLAVAADVRAHAAQVRASVLVINLAPIAFCAFATATDPRTADFLFRSPLGWSFLAAGVGLDAVSALWMRRLARVPA
jgi:tight adherence protein B